MNTEFVNIAHALHVATQHGASSFYTPFKQALFADKAVKRAIIAEAQGARRTVYRMPRDVAEEFGRRYAAEHPKKRTVVPVKAAVIPHKDQLELPLPEPEPEPEQTPQTTPQDSQEELKSAVSLLSQRVSRLEEMLHSIDTKLVRLLLLWEGDDK